MAGPALYGSRWLAEDRTSVCTLRLASGYCGHPADGWTGRGTDGQRAALRLKRAGAHGNPAGILSTHREAHETLESSDRWESALGGPDPGQPQFRPTQ